MGPNKEVNIFCRLFAYIFSGDEDHGSGIDGTTV